MTLVPCLMLTVLVGAVLPLSPDVNTFIALRFVHGMAKIGFFVTAFVWNMEVLFYFAKYGTFCFVKYNLY